eukprot:2628043-Rhodomonas_salina.2
MDAREKGKDDHCTGKHVPTLSALCITDFGKTGAAVLALPQFQPRRFAPIPRRGAESSRFSSRIFAFAIRDAVQHQYVS